MRVPEFMFVIVNPVMRFILNSPLHFIFSGSIMVIEWTGRKSGRRYATPVRYMRDGDTIRCSTEKKNLWWRNMRGGAEVTLRIAGQDAAYHANVVDDNFEFVQSYMRDFYAAFPQDAVYMNVRLNPDKTPRADDLARAASETVVIEALAVEALVQARG